MADRECESTGTLPYVADLEAVRQGVGADAFIVNGGAAQELLEAILDH
jgi:hypothetical protein